MDDIAADLLVESVRLHYQAGNEQLSSGQWGDHQEYGFCPACVDALGIDAITRQAALVAS